jgi:long-chain acyl-CoA synthetase
MCPLISYTDLPQMRMGGPKGCEMIDLVDMIVFHADASPEKPAVITGQVILTYAMLRRGILSAQRRLRQHGLKSGDVVALSGFAPVGHVTLICALHRSGIASVSLEADQLSLLGDLVVKVHLAAATGSQTATRTIMVDDSWFTDKDAEVDRSPMSAADDDGPCRFILSSGTTGRPKIIALSFGSVRERLISYSIRASTPSWDRMVCEPGLATNYGYSFMVTTLWLGRTICFALETSVREAILSNQAELLVASTHQIMALVQAQEQQFFRLDSLRSVHIGGSVAYAPLQARIRMMVCPTLHCGYGSTEGGTVAYSPAEAIFGMDRTVGVVAPWIEVEAMEEGDKVAQYGRAGEIRLRGLGQGYRCTKVTPDRYEIDSSEWFYPGDQGVLYRNGLLAIIGRVNEIINRGGTKVAPDEIEEAIRQHQAISDAAAVGMLDNVGIEQIWVAVVSRDGSELDITKMFDYCRASLPQYVPDRIFQVPAIPRNQLGKVSRVELADHLRSLESDLVLTLR